MADAAVAGSDLPLALSDEDQARFVTPSGEIEDGLTVQGFLKLLAGVDLAAVKPELRPRLTRYQERVRSLWAAEQIRSTPRDIGKLLVEEFSGRALDDALGQAFDGNPHAFGDALDRILDACARSLS